MHLMAGVLGQIEKSAELDAIMTEVRIRVAGSMFGEQDREVIQEALDLVPEVHRELEAVGEIELIVQVTALRGPSPAPGSWERPS